ncbi:MAG: MBL fold metallo-hydrolase RNA specificity domain-containing protein, partial [Anaerostipes hadrus]
FEKKPEEVFVVHGEDAVCEAFTSCLKDEYKFKARAPYSGDVFDLIAGEWTEWGSRERIQKKPKQSSAYIRLLTASERLKSVIEHNEGGTNKDLGKFADQIIALCDKWER